MAAPGSARSGSQTASAAWAFGLQLYATHDRRPALEARIPTRRLRVTDLETVNGIVFAVWARRVRRAPGADFAAGCTTFSLYSSPAKPTMTGHRCGASTGLQVFNGGAPSSAQLVLTGATGYLMTPSGQLVSGPVTRPASFAHGHHISRASRCPMATCAPGAAETGPVDPSTAGHAGLHRPWARAAVCADQATGNQQSKTLRAARRTAGAPGARAGQAFGPGHRHVAVRVRPASPGWSATSTGIDVSANAPGGATAPEPGTQVGARRLPGGYSLRGHDHLAARSRGAGQREHGRGLVHLRRRGSLGEVPGALIAAAPGSGRKSPAATRSPRSRVKTSASSTGS